MCSTKVNTDDISQSRGLGTDISQITNIQFPKLIPVPNDFSLVITKPEHI